MPPDKIDPWLDEHEEYEPDDYEPDDEELTYDEDGANVWTEWQDFAGKLIYDSRDEE